MLDTSAVYAIRFYQRYLSPYKGFQCAYRAHTGRHSCSEYAKRIIRKRGVNALFTALPRQFARCRSAYTALLAAQAAQFQTQQPSQKKKDKSDYCPLDACSGCDVPFERIDLPCDIGPCDCSL